jgi:DNA-binding transcriptional MerR regulator
MGKYSIKDLEQLSGIKAHTIRIWEKRHHIVEPQRTDTNIRYYSDEDLKRIMNVSVLNTHGIKISKIINLTNEELGKKVSELSESKNDTEIYIDQLVIAMVDLEEEKFEKILSNLTLKFGFERTVIEILYPFLEKIGILWMSNNISPAQEHFISNLIRQKIIVAIDNLPLAPKSSKRVLLYLPENELHEIGLLFYHYITKKLGYRTYYLGQSVPYADLKSIYETHNPEILISSFTSSPNAHHLDNYLNKISSAFPKARILISGILLKKLKSEPKPNIEIFSSALKIRELLL